MYIFFSLKNKKIQKSRTRKQKKPNKQQNETTKQPNNKNKIIGTWAELHQHTIDDRNFMVSLILYGHDMEAQEFLLSQGDTWQTAFMEGDATLAEVRNRLGMHHLGFAEFYAFLLSISFVDTYQLVKEKANDTGPLKILTNEELWEFLFQVWQSRRS